MSFTVQIFANDAAHRFGDDVRHLQANRLDGPLALGIDIPTGRLDDPPGLFAGLFLSFLLNLFRGPVRAFDDLPRLRAIVGDRAYTGLARLAARKGLSPDIMRTPAGRPGLHTAPTVGQGEHAFAQLGRWRRLSRCYEGTVASARTWLKVASVGYVAWRAST